MTSESHEPIAKLLLKLGLINERDFKSNWQSSEHLPIAHFGRLGRYEEKYALSTVADKLKVPIIPFTALDRIEYSRNLDHPLFANIVLERWQELRAVPIKVESHLVTIAMADPLIHDATQRLSFDLGIKIAVALAKEDEIVGLLAKRQSGDSLPELPEVELAADEDLGAEAEESILDVAAAPVVRLVNKIIADGVQAGASDLHLSPEQDKLLVRMRVDGIMRPLFEVPRKAIAAVISRIKLLAGLDISEKRRPQDGRIRIKTPLGSRDLRISTVPALHGENTVIRILASEVKAISFSQLGLNEDLQAILEYVLQGSSRLVLVTGPTGSGKTSTLYACLQHLHNGSRNIITVEDPIEYRLEGITQIQLNHKIGMTFAQGLRSILRQDPDIIMVGEIRDTETAQVAIQAAQTGHLVLATMHTNSAAGAVTRLVDLGVAPFLASTTLAAVVAQRLVRKLCKHCIKDRLPNPAEQERVGPEVAHIAQADGCEHCGASGYQGRVGIYSLLLINDAVGDAIRAGKSEAEFESLARANFFKDLFQSGRELVVEKATSLAEVERTLGPLPRFGIREVRPTQAKASSGLSKQTVLLVEDDENTRTVLSLLLQREMFEVIEAEDGIAALEELAAATEPPTLILCDLMMPRMDGNELVKRLRRDPKLAAVPILMLTAADSEENEIRILEGGADDFVSKTADSKVMLARIWKLVERL